MNVCCIIDGAEAEIDVERWVAALERTGAVVEVSGHADGESSPPNGGPFDLAMALGLGAVQGLFEIPAGAYAVLVPDLDDQALDPGDPSTLVRRIALDLPVSFLALGEAAGAGVAALRPDATVCVVSDGAGDLDGIELGRALDQLAHSTTPSAVWPRRLLADLSAAADVYALERSGLLERVRVLEADGVVELRTGLRRAWRSPRVALVRARTRSAIARVRS